MARKIQRYGEATPGLDQYAIKKFGEALEVVPKILADNAGRVFTEVISSLYAAHAKGNCSAGVNIEVCTITFKYFYSFRMETSATLLTLRNMVLLTFCR